jgi:hypothetical protein
MPNGAGRGIFVWFAAGMWVQSGFWPVFFFVDNLTDVLEERVMLRAAVGDKTLTHIFPYYGFKRAGGTYKKSLGTQALFAFC